jgi:DNA-binding transcriptional MerR regulator
MSQTIGGVDVLARSVMAGPFGPLGRYDADDKVWTQVQSQGGGRMKIGQVADLAAVSVDTVRFYERRGVLPTPERTASGYRTYTSATVERIRLARRLQRLGFTLDEVIDALHASDGGGLRCRSERWRLEAVLGRIDDKIAELGATRRRVQEVMAGCDNGTCVFDTGPRPPEHAAP